MFNGDEQPKRSQQVDAAANAQLTTQNIQTALGKGSTNKGPADQASNAASIHSLPLKDVPDRQSSLATSRQASLQNFPSWSLPPPAAAGRLIPPRGRAESPIKRSIDKDAVSSESIRMVPRTFIRTSPPLRLIENGSIRHKRVQMTVNLNAPLYVGGGTIEGDVKLVVDKNDQARSDPKDLSISKLSIDVVGLEEVFLALACEIFDEKHPPPRSINPNKDALPGPELFWLTRAGITSVKFCVNLPLNIGPPAYDSKQASIRHVLLATMVLKSGEKRAIVSQVCDIQMLTVFDPYKALSSLPRPLVATESLELPSAPGPQAIKLTAGLHRQTWVSGNSIFVDIHIVNQSQRSLRKLELQLQRSTLWYEHAAAGTGSKNANHLRLPKKQENEIVHSTVVKKVKNWKLTPPNTSEIRTCHIQVPQGHVSISTGRFFEVRYFLNVVVAVALFKSITVQLPISLIHMNSLDIVPNALAQVAASIEAKRSKTLPIDLEHQLYQPYHQGQAFVAPQRHSLEQSRSRRQSTASAGLEELRHELDESPRRYRHHQRSSTRASRETLNPRYELGPSKGYHHKHDHDCCCYHCHLHDIKHDGRPSTSTSEAKARLPRLQVSTSGVGFTETEFSEFSISDSPPKKVMLSEQERKMVHRQRELQQRKEHSEMQRRASATASRHNSWRNRSKQPRLASNASVLLEHQIRRAEPHILEKQPPTRRRAKTLESPLTLSTNMSMQRQPDSARKRSNTGPDLQRMAKSRADQAPRSVAFPQDPPQLTRLSSKRRGKLPDDGFVLQQENPASRCRPTSRGHPGQRTSYSREMGDRLMR